MAGAGDRTVEGLRFVMTCDRSPEQYDVFFENTQVGYVRLRWGFLIACAPDADGDEILTSGDDDHIGDGDFDTEELRILWLTRAAHAIRGRISPDRLGGVG